MQTEEEKQTKVGFLRLLGMVHREWPYVVLGVLCAACTGAVMPLFAELLGSVTAALQPWEPASKILKFCIMFWALGAAQLATGTLQVCSGCAHAKLHAHAVDVSRPAEHVLCALDPTHLSPAAP